MKVDWDDRYRTGDTPWDSGAPSAELRRVLAEYRIPAGPALEMGCGTGANCVYLAKQGFDVTGVDLSPRAIQTAQAMAAREGARCRFVCGDVFSLPDLGPPFPFIFDRGCYHVVRNIDERRVVDVYHWLLSEGGFLLILAGNANEESSPEGGPPRVSEAELRAAFDGRFRTEHLRTFRFDASPDRDMRPLAWSLLLRKL